MTIDRWLVTLDDEDAEVHHGTREEAIAKACASWGCSTMDEGVFARLWTEEDERYSRNARRRERYAERRAAGQIASRSSDDPGASAKIPMMAWLSLSTGPHGKPRCPTCGRWRRWVDFIGAPHGSVGGGMAVDFAPSCAYCRARAQRSKS